MKHLYLCILTLSITFSVSAQNSFEYIVEPLAYQVYQEQNVVQFNQDDVHSGVITMPFMFNFYELGLTDQFVVGSNGTVTFDVALAGTSQPWQINTTSLIPSGLLPKPAILGPYQDMDNSAPNNGGVYTGVTGVAPNRRFHVTFEDVPQYSTPCNNLLNTTQIILHETSRIIDVVMTEKTVCSSWNGGLAVLGLQAGVNGAIHGISAPDRNTGIWTAQEEAWRFTPTSFLNGFDVVLCDLSNDGSELFNISTYKEHLMTLFNLDPNVTTIDISHEGTVLTDDTINVILGDNLPENVYDININNGTQFFPFTVALVNCENDGDADGLTNGEEDVNGNGDLNDDDTDGDGIPNYLDDDDDGDTVLTNIEIVFGRSNGTIASRAAFLDTDSDGIPDHLDFDDDGDGVLTLDEDYNGNGDPTDDDVNTNGIPDYLDNAQLSVADISTNTNLFSVYPNPASNQIFVKFAESGFWGDSVKTRVYDYQGRLIVEVTQTISNSEFKMDVSQLAAGSYLLIVEKNNFLKAKKFVVK